MTIKSLLVAWFTVSAVASISPVLAKEDLPNATKHIETIVLGSGCFWGAEKRYEALNGVLDAVSGYADGQGFKATYKNITRSSRRFDENN